MHSKNQRTCISKSWTKIISCLNLALVSVFLLFTSGCMRGLTPLAPTETGAQEGISELETDVQENLPHVSPYVDVVVTNVQFRYLETNPVQIEIVVEGTLPDQCKYDFYSLENRSEQNVKITLKGIHPAESCEQVYQSVEYVLLLGRDLPANERGFLPGTYFLTINDYQTDFSIKEE